MGLLIALGLMTVAEHERIVDAKDDETYKGWATATSGHDASLTRIASLERTVANQRATIEKMMPDALAMRRKRANDAANKREKRRKAKGEAK